MDSFTELQMPGRAGFRRVAIISTEDYSESALLISIMDGYQEATG